MREWPASSPVRQQPFSSSLLILGTMNVKPTVLVCRLWSMPAWTHRPCHAFLSGYNVPSNLLATDSSFCPPTLLLKSELPTHGRALTPCPLPLSVKRRQSEEHTSELQSRPHLVCRPLLE